MEHGYYFRQDLVYSVAYGSLWAIAAVAEVMLSVVTVLGKICIVEFLISHSPIPDLT